VAEVTQAELAVFSLGFELNWKELAARSLNTIHATQQHWTDIYWHISV